MSVTEHYSVIGVEYMRNFGYSVIAQHSVANKLEAEAIASSLLPQVRHSVEMNTSYHDAMCFSPLFFL